MFENLRMCVLVVYPMQLYDEKKDAWAPHGWDVDLECCLET